MAYYPTPTDARTVEMWTRAGIGRERIAKRLSISVTQLEATFPYELGFTEDESLAIVSDVAFQMATSGKSPAMTKFWLETRGGWQTGFNGQGMGDRKPLQIIIDAEVAEEVEYEEVEESNVLEFKPETE